MDKFMGAYAPGMPAMIINARTEHGRKFIGRVVTLIEPITTASISGNYARDGQTIVYDVKGPKAWMVVGDITSHDDRLKEGFACVAEKNLMPLPPLNEKQIQKEKEKELV